MMAGDDRERALRSALGKRLGTHVRRLDQIVLAMKSEALRPLGVTVPQYVTLFSVAHLQPTSGAQLARAAQTTPQTMSAILTTLDDKGLITRKPSAAHQKVLEVRLSPAGADLLGDCDRIMQDIESRLRAEVGEDNFAALLEMSRILDSAE